MACDYRPKGEKNTVNLFKKQCQDENWVKIQTGLWTRGAWLQQLLRPTEGHKSWCGFSHTFTFLSGSVKHMK